MIYPDQDIVKLLLEGIIAIDPLEDPDTQIQPASVDLRLGPEVFLPASQEFNRAKHVDITSGRFDIRPGEFLLGTTIERVRLPAGIAARVEGRSSLGRLGLLVHVSAGFIDPGFDGQITLELANLSTRPIRLTQGMRICQVVFHAMTAPSARPYGPERGSHYQGQRGVTPSVLAQPAGKGAP